MADVRVSVVHNEFGEIVSVSRPDYANVIVMSKDGQSVLITEVDENDVENLIGTHRVDVSRNALQPVKP